MKSDALLWSRSVTQPGSELSLPNVLQIKILQVLGSSETKVLSVERHISKMFHVEIGEIKFLFSVKISDRHKTQFVRISTI